MRDVVERLRDTGMYSEPDLVRLCRESADEIERLRRGLNTVFEHLDPMCRALIAWGFDKEIEAARHRVIAP
jgi:hypothetical protein